jgi:pimeloyl-ACP methyl ester carboxylesterase
MGTDIGIVRAKKSDRWYPEILSRLEETVQANTIPRQNVGTLSYHVLENAGHWLHVDNPNGLIEILAPSLVRIASK